MSHQLPKHHQLVSLRWAACLSSGISKSNVRRDCFCYKLHWWNKQGLFESCKSLTLILIWCDTSWPGQAYEISWGEKSSYITPALCVSRAAPPSTRQQAFVLLNTQKWATLSHTTVTHHAFRLLSPSDHVLKQAGNKKFSYQPWQGASWSSWDTTH